MLVFFHFLASYLLSFYLIVCTTSRFHIFFTYICFVTDHDPVNLKA